MSPDETPEHLQVTRSSQGFTFLPPIVGTYGGYVQVYESSGASGPHVGVKVDEGATEPVHLDLTAEAAWQLSRQLQYLVENNYLGMGALPETVRREIAHKHRGEMADE